MVAATARRTRSAKIRIEENIDPNRVPELVALENRCFRSVYRPHRYDAQAFSYYLHNPKTISLMATVDSVIVGYVLGIVGSGSRRHLARVHSIAVDGPYRRHGIGRRLAKAFIRLAKKRGCTIIHSEVAASAKPARQLFTDLGFMHYRRLPDHYGEDVDGIRLRLTLGE